jgi:predicted GH43/DUF377 family glycosyl hydrolase
MPKSLKVKRLGVILEPTENSFESEAVLNPGCYQDGKFVHLFYRAIDKDLRSCIGYAKLKGPTKVIERWKKPIINREYDYESRGVEDPRIVKINDTFYLFYVAHDGKNAVTAYAISHSPTKFKKMGIITPQLTYYEAEGMLKKTQLKDAYFFHASLYRERAGDDILFWAKDTFLFPKKINGKFYLITRVLPDIQIVAFNSFEELTIDFWKNYFQNLSKYVILENKHWFETRHIGGGCPPVETKDGWIFIFHAVEESNRGRVYHTCAALLKRENPFKVIGRLHEPLFSPEENWEKFGLVPNVVFATGTAVFNEKLYIYYGAADKRIAVVSVNINELLEEMQDPAKSHVCAKKNSK